MEFRLPESVRVEGYRLEAFETVGSTNEIALERARAGDPGRIWFVSAHQQSGRGRRGREWRTEPGNLAATLLLVPDVEMTVAATLGFVAGLSLSQALERAAPDARLGVGLDGGSGRGVARFELKWPNDVLADGAKLSGILLESAMLGADRYALAIGIGVNVVSYPPDLPYPATSLRALGSQMDAADLFQAMSEAWLANLAIWDRGRGLAAIRQAWLQRAAGIGAPAAVRLSGRVVRGVFETIDDECRIVIREPDGEAVLVAAGDVHFGAVASAAMV